MSDLRGVVCEDGSVAAAIINLMYYVLTLLVTFGGSNPRNRKLVLYPGQLRLSFGMSLELNNKWSQFHGKKVGHK
jgi:hypothetical protein